MIYEDLTFYELCKLYEDYVDCEVRITHNDSCSEFKWGNTNEDLDYRYVYVERIDGLPVTCNLLITGGWRFELLKGEVE